MTTITKNISNGFFSTVPMDYDCCLILEKTHDFSKLPLSIPLSNILSSTDDLRMASHKVDKVEKMIKDQETKDYSQLYKHITSLSAIMSTFMFLIISCFSCCCSCRGYRTLWFKTLDKWSTKNCLKETSDKLCINIMNVQGKQPFGKVSNHEDLSYNLHPLPTKYSYHNTR